MKPILRYFPYIPSVSLEQACMTLSLALSPERGADYLPFHEGKLSALLFLLLDFCIELLIENLVALVAFLGVNLYLSYGELENIGA
jgi:hypothetical protein